MITILGKSFVLLIIILLAIVALALIFEDVDKWDGD